MGSVWLRKPDLGPLFFIETIHARSRIYCELSVFFFRDPIRPDRPVLIDPVQAELKRRILFAPPGPLGQLPTYAQIAAELNGRKAASAHALDLIKAGPVLPALATLDRLLTSDFECVEVGSQPPPGGAEAGDFRDPDEAHPRAENHEKRIKLESCKSASALVDKTATYPNRSPEQDDNHTYCGTADVKSPTHSDRKRRHKNDVPWPEKEFVQGHKVSTTLSKKERKWVDDALLRLKVLMGRKGVLVCITMKPKHLDALDPVERMRYWEPFVNRFRSYRAKRCEVLRRRLSSWPVWCVWVRESDPDNHLGEHCHMIVWMPDREEADHLIKVVQDDEEHDYEGWGENTQAQRVDAEERMVGGKLSSFFNYLLKAVHPRSRFAYHTIGWQPSGALVGKRYFITTNLTNRQVIADTEVGVATLKRVRDEKKLAAFRRRAKAEREELESYGPPALAQHTEEAMSPEEAGYMSQGSGGPVHREAAHGEDQGGDLASACSPAEIPSPPSSRLLAAKPSSIEQAICPEPRSAGPVHGGAEHREMDIVEMETRPAEPAPAAPPPMPHDLGLPAIEVGDVTPSIPVPEVFVPDHVTPVPAEATSASSSPGASLRPLAMLRRSVARSAAAGVGWIASRFRPRPSPSESTPPTPLVHPATALAIGALFGAPDIGSTPW